MSEPLRLTMSSMDLARVRETTQPDDEALNGYRTFDVGNDDTAELSHITYWVHVDMARCERHMSFDNCTCTARLRLCGATTNTVVEDVKHWKRAR